MNKKLIGVVVIILFCSGCIDSSDKDNDKSDVELLETSYFFNININTNLSNYILIVPVPIDIDNKEIFPIIYKDLMGSNLNIVILNKTEKVNQQALCIYGNGSMNINFWGPLNKTDISYDLSQNVNTSLSNCNDYWIYLKTNNNESIECSYSYLEVNGDYFIWNTLLTNEYNQIMNVTISPGWNQYSFHQLWAIP